MKLDHIGYVVGKIEKELPFFVSLMKPVEVSEIQPVVAEQVRVVFLILENGARIEWVEPAGETSPVSRTAQKGVRGVHHLCYEVLDLESETRRLRALGCVPLGGPKYSEALCGKTVFFGTPMEHLIELVQRKNVVNGST